MNKPIVETISNDARKPQKISAAAEAEARYKQFIRAKTRAPPEVEYYHDQIERKLARQQLEYIKQHYPQSWPQPRQFQQQPAAFLQHIPPKNNDNAHRPRHSMPHIVPYRKIACCLILLIVIVSIIPIVYIAKDRMPTPSPTPAPFIATYPTLEPIGEPTKAPTECRVDKLKLSEGEFRAIPENPADDPISINSNDIFIFTADGDDQTKWKLIKNNVPWFEGNFKPLDSVTSIGFQGNPSRLPQVVYNLLPTDAPYDADYCLGQITIGHGAGKQAAFPIEGEMGTLRVIFGTKDHPISPGYIKKEDGSTRRRMNDLQSSSNVYSFSYVSFFTIVSVMIAAAYLYHR